MVVEAVPLQFSFCVPWHLQSVVTRKLFTDATRYIFIAVVTIETKIIQPPKSTLPFAAAIDCVLDHQNSQKIDCDQFLIWRMVFTRCICIQTYNSTAFVTYGSRNVQGCVKPDPPPHQRWCGGSPTPPHHFWEFSEKLIFLIPQKGRSFALNGEKFGDR